MPVGATIRPERIADHEVITEVVSAAFSGRPYSDGTEAQLVQELRAQCALSVSLVAETAGAVVGHIAFSPAFPADGTSRCFALGPVAVLPGLQRKGIGSALIIKGLEAIRTLGANACILVGDPCYYSRFGFVLSPPDAPTDQPAQYFMVKHFGDCRPVGPISFHRAFKRAAYKTLLQTAGLAAARPPGVEEST